MSNAGYIFKIETANGHWFISAAESDPVKALCVWAEAVENYEMAIQDSGVTIERIGELEVSV